MKKVTIRYMRTDKTISPLEIIDKGEWIDLRLAETVHLSQGEFKLLSLGVRIQLPPEFEAWIVPRSGTFKNFGILQANSLGVIDSTYCGPDDIWRFPAYATKAVAIQKDTRICQFRIMPSQKARSLVKELWDWSDGVELVEEEWLEGNEESRGGFGSTGVQ